MDEEQENLEKRVERLRSWSYAAEMLRIHGQQGARTGKGSSPTRISDLAPEESWTDAPALTKMLVKLPSAAVHINISGMR